ncbi:flagellar hook-basal body protein [Lederbergia wuyishanensis]|uniref:Flagellar basal-body rod protein FlgG n=1 Tax=Lederbergia wuyishanensis TaxID=1347903 RepID=A0ABU0D3B2_9BACI|nr:flagellar hook-basal body protein [Lederbergia wuyishanensis]MCJ8007938.1 flagellar hook-basal body protein [Lederbergia wuyishanensis]MDQ0342894.1 flagellar basal-body rod protein FlgG [Lederbergia wuyishanensis]
MLRGFYTVASGMFAQQRKTDLLTNNMANINTPGFKEDTAAIRAFPEMLLQRIDSSNSRSKTVGPINTGVYMQETLPRFIQGDLRQTDLGTDLALTDLEDTSVFFTVEVNGQTKYTRNGRFTLDAEGLLTTAEGFPVLDVNGNRIRLNSDQFKVTSNGTIEEDGVQVARLGIGAAENPETLIKEGNGLYRTENNGTLPNADGIFSVSQGFIEASNVDPTRAMAEMLTAYRAFEANQKIIQAYDKSLDKAVNEIGKV